MLITPRPGADRKNIRERLRDVHTAAFNLQGFHGTAFQELLAYLEWATESASVLRSLISDKDLNNLIFTDRYRALLASCGTLAGTAQERFVRGRIRLEVTERLEALEAAQKTLDEQITRWTGLERFVVADPSFYIQNETKLADADLHQILGIREEDPIRLLFPIVVVDELDELKDAKGRARWRAAHTLGRLDEVLGGRREGILRDGTYDPQNGETLRKVVVEIVLDPPGHVRLPIEDDEIIDRAVAIQGLAAREVRLLTCDTGQRTRGCNAGLKVTKVAVKDPGPEPDWDAQNKPANGTRARRRERQAAGDADQE
jgi:hypothetical protein